MQRRTLSLSLILVLIAGLFGYGPVLSLACPTRERAAGAAIKADAPHSCCSSVMRVAPNNSGSAAVSGTSCCKITPTPEKQDTPAVVAGFVFAVATVPSEITVHPPLVTERVPFQTAGNSAVPRAPPLDNSASRAPPTLS